MEVAIIGLLGSVLVVMFGGFGALWYRLGRLEGIMTGIEGRLNHLEGRMAGIEGRLNHLEDRMARLEEGIAGIEGRLIHS